jgi:hypothetical protein
MNKKPELLDTVAVLHDMPDKSLKQGQVGTIVELLRNNFYEVEFTNKMGETIFTKALSSNDFLVLYYAEEML